MNDVEPIRDIVFDLDGTLIDSAPSIIYCLAKVMTSQGVRPKLKLDRVQIGPPLQQILRKVSGVEDEKIISEMSKEFILYYDSTGYKNSELYVGIVEMLNCLNNSGFRMHIATNKRLRPTLSILDYFGIRRVFNSIYAIDSGDAIFTGKVEMLAVQINKENIKKENMVYIGDRIDDMLAASEVGVRFIAATWGAYEMKADFNNHFQARKPKEILNYVS